MAAKNRKPTELTDIPLTLEQGDSVELAASKSEKMKTNSLKRFFRTARTSMPETSNTIESPEVSGNIATEGRSSRTLGLRFGSFGKKDGLGIRQANSEFEAGSSAVRSKSKSPPPPSESRLSLQGRLSNYWGTVFKKSAKRVSTADVLAQATLSSPVEVNQIEQDEAENL